MIKIMLILDSVLLSLYLVTEVVTLAWLTFGGIAITAISSILNTFITHRGNKVIIAKQDQAASEQKIIKEQTDGKLTELLHAATGKAAAEATVKGKDELIEVLKQTDPLKTETDKPVDVIVKRNEDKLL